MSCYSCGSSFGRFKKELGCKNCGYAFCKDCLPKKVEIPKLKNEKHKVCLKCYKILTGQAEPEKKTQYSPPKALQKRLAKLDNPETQPHQGPKVQPNTGLSRHQYKGMSAQDAAIADRLQKLKDAREKDQAPVPSQREMEDRLQKLKKGNNDTPPPTEDEMSNRLAKLRGQNPTTANKPHVFLVDRRPQTQQVDDLLQEICNEVDIDSHGLDHAADVQNRLDAYRGIAPSQESDIQNNLNKPGDKTQEYTKNIPHFGDKYETVSGEDVSFSDMNNLVQQVADELNVDAQTAIVSLQKDKDIWERLTKLKKKDNKTEVPQENTTEQDSSRMESAATDVEDTEQDDEEACKMIIKQLLEENRFEEKENEDEVLGKKMNKLPKLPSASAGFEAAGNVPTETAESDELPWCCICNSDASVRCLGCDGDLYCKRCYKEGHDRADYADHPTKSFKSPGK